MPTLKEALEAILCLAEDNRLDSDDYTLGDELQEEAHFQDACFDAINVKAIVKACDCHGELTRACKAAKRYLEPDLVEPGRTIFWNLVKALAKATK